MDKGLAHQIRATRKLRKWNKTELAEAAGMTPNNFARLEDPEYGKHTISSLKRIAAALDVALVVRLVPFSQYIDWLSGTPYTDHGISEEALAVPSFEMEEQQGKFEQLSFNALPYLSIDNMFANAATGLVGTSELVTPSSDSLLIESNIWRGTYQPTKMFVPQLDKAA